MTDLDTLLHLTRAIAHLEDARRAVLEANAPPFWLRTLPNEDAAIDALHEEIDRRICSLQRLTRDSKYRLLAAATPTPTEVDNVPKTC